MKIDLNKKYETTNGEPAEVKFFRADPDGNMYAHGVILRTNEWLPRKWAMDGITLHSVYESDLREVVEELTSTEYINVYEDGSKVLHQNMDEADRLWDRYNNKDGNWATSKRIARVTVDLKYKRGYGLF